MSLIGLWFGVLRNPKKIFSVEKQVASFKKGLKHLVVLSVFIAGLYILMAVGLSVFFKLSFFLFLAPIAIILFPIQLIIGVLIQSGIVYLIGRAFGGKGTFQQLFYLTSIMYSAILFLLTLFMFIFALLFFGVSLVVPVFESISFILLAIFSVILSFYSLYLFYLLLKEVFETSVTKILSIIVILIFLPLFIITVVVGLLLTGTNVNDLFYSPEETYGINPNYWIANGISEAFQDKGEIIETQPFTFGNEKNNLPIRHSTIKFFLERNGEKTLNIPEKQVCLLLSKKLEPSSEIQIVDPGKEIAFYGDPLQQFKAFVKCDLKPNFDEEEFTQNKCPNTLGTGFICTTIISRVN